MKTKTAIYELLRSKAAGSSNPDVFVPRPSSMPEFFLSAKSLAYPRLVKGTVTTDIAARGVVLERQDIPVQVACVFNGKTSERLLTFGQN